MTTTELIELLKKHERGGATGRPREVMFEVDDRIIDTDGIEVTGSGDGLISELYLSLPSAQPDNQTNLCDSCDYSFPDCPSKYEDVIFGNGIGNDNICACNKQKPSAQPEREKGEWIPISKETNPTKSGWYLVTVHEDATNDNERFTGMAEFNATNGMWYDIDEPTDMYLRWMPLPAPYRGGDT